MTEVSTGFEKIKLVLFLNQLLSRL